MRWSLISLVLACSGKGSGDDTGPGEGDTDTDTDTDTEGITYPSGDRVLLTSVHGGHQGALTGTAMFEDIDPLWKKDTGWNTDWYTDLPEDLHAYRMIGLLHPGFEKESPFTGAEIDALAAALDRGTRIIVFGEHQGPGGACTSATLNQTLEALGVDVRFLGTGADTNMIVKTSSVDATNQMVSGVASLRLKDPCHVTGGRAVVSDSTGNALVAFQRPRSGGEVVAIGDMSFFDDTEHILDADNYQFSLNLITVTP